VQGAAARDWGRDLGEREGPTAQSGRDLGEREGAASQRRTSGAVSQVLDEVGECGSPTFTARCVGYIESGERQQAHGAGKGRKGRTVRATLLHALRPAGH
jgi:hypothetical protein